MKITCEKPVYRVGVLVRKAMDERLKDMVIKGQNLLEELVGYRLVVAESITEARERAAKMVRAQYPYAEAIGFWNTEKLEEGYVKKLDAVREYPRHKAELVWA